MPGKVNPTQSNAVTMAGCGGHLQMNIYKPLLGFNLLRATALLEDCCRSLRVHLVEGLEVDGHHIGALRDRSLMLVTALAPDIGYDPAARVALHAHARQLGLRDAALTLGVITAERFDQVVNSHAMAHPGGGRFRVGQIVAGLCNAWRMVWWISIESLPFMVAILRSAAASRLTHPTENLSGQVLMGNGAERHIIHYSVNGALVALHAGNEQFIKSTGNGIGCRGYGA